MENTPKRDDTSIPLSRRDILKHETGHHLWLDHDVRGRPEGMTKREIEEILLSLREEEEEQE